MKEVIKDFFDGLFAFLILAVCTPMGWIGLMMIALIVASCNGNHPK